MVDQFALLKRAVSTGDVAEASRLLEAHPAWCQRSLQPGCGEPPLLALAGSRPMADALLAKGADPVELGAWWESGLFLGSVVPEVAEYLIEKGTPATIHTLAGLGLVDRVRATLDSDPQLVHAAGGDGCTPLHFARDQDTAELLVDRGAVLDARDEDHDSTAAQWRIGDSPDVTRFLLERGATADIFLAAGLGDLELTRRLIDADPKCPTYRIGNNHGPFPGIGHRGRGGTILQWTLGFNRSPHEVAIERGHHVIYDLLWSHTPPRHQLLVACMRADRATAARIVADHPAVVAELDDDDKSLLAKSCWETNLNLEAVRLMLDLGFPIDVAETNHGYSALHNAAWCGAAQLVQFLIERGHAVELLDPEHHSSPLGWAIYSAVTAGRHPEGDFGGVVGYLLAAGASVDPAIYPVGHDGIDEVLRRQFGLDFA